MYILKENKTNDESKLFLYKADKKKGFFQNSLNYSLDNSFVSYTSENTRNCDIKYYEL